MKTDKFNKFVDHVLERTKATLSNKAKEYSTYEDRFSDFNKATGLSFHESREKVAWEYMCKHLQSIKNILDHVEIGVNGHPTKELVSEKFKDSINYLILIEAMILDKIDKYEKFKQEKFNSGCETKRGLYDIVNSKSKPSDYVQETSEHIMD